MPKKRKSGGRSRGKKGTASAVSCASCGQRVARDKAKKFTTYSSGVDYRLAQEIKADGGYIPRRKKIQYYCISCAIHRKKVNVGRQKGKRKKR